MAASGPNNTLSAQAQAEAQQRDARAVELASAGMSYEQIARELGCSKSTAHGAVMRALARLQSPHVDELRRVQTAEIGEVRAAWWDKAVACDPKAAAVVVRCWERMARLWGLDAPVKVDATVRDEVDQQIIALAAQIDTNAPVDRGAAAP